MFGDLRISPAHIPNYFLAHVEEVTNDEDGAKIDLNRSEMYKPDDEEFKSQYYKPNPIRPVFHEKTISRMICVEDFVKSSVSFVFMIFSLFDEFKKS